MLGFLYLLLILGWILIIALMKCKKTVVPHMMESQARAHHHEDTRNSPSIHVIHIDPADYQEFSRQFGASSSTLPTELLGDRRSVLSECRGHPPAHNLAFVPDENYISNAPPPSYEEVMRKPDVYPKVENPKPS